LSGERSVGFLGNLFTRILLTEMHGEKGNQLPPHEGRVTDIFGATGRSTSFSLSKREQQGPNCTREGIFRLRW
jgi:hypothetical protein